MTTLYIDSSFSSPVSSRSSSYIHNNNPSSPNRDRVVRFCRNCSHSFRVSNMNCSEFCSRDCETCFTIFYKQISPAPPKVNDERTIIDIRFSIYEFQQQIDAHDRDSYDSATNNNNSKQKLDNGDSLQSDDPDMNLSLEDNHHSHSSSSTKTILGRWSNRLFFASPKSSIRRSPMK